MRGLHSIALCRDCGAFDVDLARAIGHGWAVYVGGGPMLCPSCLADLAADAPRSALPVADGSGRLRSPSDRLHRGEESE